VNDATRLFGAALGVAVIGSVAASLYTNRLGSTMPANIPADAASAAKGSLGGALVASQHLAQSGLSTPARTLDSAAIGAFLHSFAGSLRVAGTIALAGAAVAATLLPSRPNAARIAAEPSLVAALDVDQAV
jgi:DHA2 family multidrug resistance protein-like MFS transporter